MEPKTIYVVMADEAEEKDEKEAPPGELVETLRAVEEAQARFEELAGQKQTAVEEALAPVRARLMGIEEEYKARLRAVRREVRQAEMRAKEVILAHGRTVEYGKLQAVYVRGRVNWDTACLERYSGDHPEVLYFRAVKAPRVLLRRSKCK